MAARGRPRRAARRRRLRITFEGRWFLALTLGVGIAAINTGNNLLYIALAMNLSLVLVSGILSEWNLRTASVAVGLASEAFARREALLSVTCSARPGRMPAVALQVAVPLPEAPPCVRFPSVAPGTAARRVVRFRPERRGPLSAPFCVLSTRFPFGLFEKSAVVPVRGDFLVYPEPLDAEPAGAAGARPEPAGDPAGAGRRAPFIRGVRPLQPADPARDVHWKASARAGRWMAKEREGETAPVVDLRIPADASPDRLERAASSACARLLRCEREGRPYRLWVGDALRADASDPGRRARALGALALLPRAGDDGPGAGP